MPRDIQLRVRYAETDQMRVVYHANYLIWCEVGRTEYIRSVFASYAEVERKGVSLAVVEASLRFHAPARYDDLITVTTTLREARSRTMTLDYVITNADTGEKLVTASTTLASTDPNGKLVSMPADLRSALERSRE
ncbi:MAG: thioesterase family protein [Gemmatimonadaceae bacterium]